MSRTLGLRVAVLLAVIMSGAAAAQPPTNGRWTSSAIAPVQGNYNQGTPLTLTWGFMTLGTAINDTTNNGGLPNGVNNLQTRLDTIYGSQAVWQPLFQSVFDRWSGVSGLSYQFEANDSGGTIGGASGFPGGVLGTRADVRIGGKNIDGNSGILAYNYFPNVGEMVIDTNDTFFNTTTGNSIRLRNVVAHEHGHGVGMNHIDSNNGAFLMQPFINTSFDGPQYHDILAAHHQYGDVREKSNAGLGNDTAPRANSLGSIALNASTSIGNSARTLTVAPTAVDFVSIDSQTDTDFYSFSVNDTGRVTLLLEALGFTYNVTAQGAGGNVAFNTRERNNLRIALLASDGTTVLATADATGLGGNETIVFDLTATGTYYIRIQGTNNADTIALDAQFYGLTVGFAPVPEPATVLGLASLALGGGWVGRRLRARHLARSATPPTTAA